MIWLASFPRSGNTFFRNVLYEVYGISSSTYHLDQERVLDEKFDQFPVIKTHLLPKQLPPKLQGRKSVYIVRDGRDSLVSIAHHRSDIVAPGSDYYNNLLLAILSLDGSFFGGWSENVKQWTNQADLIIRFEDLIQDPIREIEKLRAIMDLPTPNLDKLPSFKDLKFGEPKYGAGKKSKRRKESLAEKHFRRGKVGSWQDEMPKELHELFWEIHGKEMKNLGYHEGEMPIPDRSQQKILIEASKALLPDHDGVHRYLIELIEHIQLIQGRFQSKWSIDLHSPQKVIGIEQFREYRIAEPMRAEPMLYERMLLGFKHIVQQVLPVSWYERVAKVYRGGPFREFLDGMRRSFMQEDREVNKEKIHYDLIHIPLPQNIALTNGFSGPLLVTVHDLTHELFPDFHTEHNRGLAEKGMDYIRDFQPHLLAVSEATKADVLRLYEYPKDKIRTIYEGAARKFNVEARQQNIKPILEKYGLPLDGTFFLCLSTIEPRKNLETTTNAFLAFRKSHPSQNVALFICGKAGWKSVDFLAKADMLSKQNVFFPGFIEDDDLVVLMAHARALCYLSIYEGFGLPILEAMQCGTPVIHSNSSSMPEVAGPGGIAVDPLDVQAIAQAMALIVEDDQLYEKHSTAALQQADTFSWFKAALHTLNYYQDILSQKSS